MIRSAVTVSLVPEARGGPFVFWDNLAAACTRAAALGFDAVEIFPRTAGELNVAEVRSLLQAHRLRLAAVGTGAGWLVQRLRLTDPDAQVRERARAFVAGVVEVAGSLGAPAIIGSMQGRQEAGASRAEAVGWLREALEELGPRAQALGVPLLLEPLNRYETNLVTSVDDGLDVLRPLQTRNVKLLVDLFHANIEEVSIGDALRRAGPALGHVHFADSNRRAVGMGHTNMGPVADALGALGYAGFVSAEVLPLPDADQAARQTMAGFRRWFRPA